MPQEDKIHDLHVNIIESSKQIQIKYFYLFFNTIDTTK